MARRHALAPTQLFTWRREFRRAVQAADIVPTVASEPEPFFVPAVIDTQSTPVTPGRTPVVRKRRIRRAREAAVRGRALGGRHSIRASRQKDSCLRRYLRQHGWRYRRRGSSLLHQSREAIDADLMLVEPIFDHL